jgi:hypothetical protein
MDGTDGKKLFWPAVVFGVLVCVSGWAFGSTLSASAKLVPPETLVLVDVGDFSVLEEQFGKTNFHKLYKDPAMSAFVEDAKTKIREKVRKQDNKIAEAIVQSKLLPEGRLAVALVGKKPGESGDKGGFLLLSEWGERSKELQEAIESEVREAVESGAHRKTEDYRGVTIVTLIRERPAIEIPNTSGQDGSSSSVTSGPQTIERPPEEVHYCFVEDCLIVSSDVEVHKFVIAHIKGASSATLGDDADYVASMKSTGPSHDIDLYVNIKRIMQTTSADDSSGQRVAMMATMGLDNVRSLGFSIGVGRLAGGSFSSKIVLGIDGEKKGIFKMLEFESAPLRAGRFMSASSSTALFLNVSIKKAFDELARMVTSISPQAAALLYMPLIPPSPSGEPGLELRRDIIEHLGSQISIARAIEQPISPDPGGASTIFAVAVDDRQGLEKTLSFLHEKLLAAVNPDSKRELLGHTIYRVELPNFPVGFMPGSRAPLQSAMEPKPASKSILALTVTDTHLLVGGEATVERAIRSLSSKETSSLDSAKWFNFAKSSLPSAVGMASLEDGAASSELAWRMLKDRAKVQNKREDSSVTVGAGMPGSGFPPFPFSRGGSELSDFSLLPEFDAVRKYFGVAVLYGISRPDGYFFEFKYLDSPKSD